MLLGQEIKIVTEIEILPPVPVLHDSIAAPKFADKHGYSIDAIQELLALGLFVLGVLTVVEAAGIVAGTDLIFGCAL